MPTLDAPIDWTKKDPGVGFGSVDGQRCCFMKQSDGHIAYFPITDELWQALTEGNRSAGSAELMKLEKRFLPDGVELRVQASLADENAEASRRWTEAARVRLEEIDAELRQSAWAPEHARGE